MRSEPKRVAAVVTEYRRHSHADVIVGKIIEGYNYDGREHPRMRVVSMYCDQVPAADMSRRLAQRFNFTIYRTIAEALTLGGPQLAVDGVLSIGEHGNYPTNERGQILYPRRRFFEQITDVFVRSRRSVPVFSDKHLSATWADARWMYDRARELHVPFLAGSSLPVAWRRPPVQLPRHSHVTEAVQIGYGPLEGYGFHALEAMQCMVENRRGGESGVRSVQFLNGTDMWPALDRGQWSRELFEAALALVPAHANGDYRQLTARDNSAGVILIDYRDGLRAAMVMLNGWVHEGDGGAFCFACRVADQPRPVATHFYLQNEDPFGHFGYQVRAIDTLINTGHAPYPVERTLLTTGILDAAMISRHERQRQVPTPYLDIRYEPTGWPFPRDPVPPRIQRPL